MIGDTAGLSGFATPATHDMESAPNIANRPSGPIYPPAVPGRVTLAVSALAHAVALIALLGSYAPAVDDLPSRFLIAEVRIASVPATQAGRAASEHQATGPTLPHPSEAPAVIGPDGESRPVSVTRSSDTMPVAATDNAPVEPPAAIAETSPTPLPVAVARTADASPTHEPAAYGDARPRHPPAPRPMPAMPEQATTVRPPGDSATASEKRMAAVKSSEITGSTGFTANAGDRTTRAAASSPPPAYPLLARRRGYEGTAIVRVTVAGDGYPAAISLARSTGYPILDEAALTAVRQWRFAPAHNERRHTETVIEVPIEFRLM